MGGFSGDGGDPRLAKLAGPQGVCVSNSGDVYIGDVGSDRIRIVTTEPLRAINANIQDHSIDIFPNPCNGNFTFIISSNREEQIKVSVTDIYGSNIQSFWTSQNKKVNIQLKALPGIYYLSATSFGSRIIKKIIIQ